MVLTLLAGTNTRINLPTPDGLVMLSSAHAPTQQFAEDGRYWLLGQ